ncbi:unnamed protein product [Dimorphilus gyrociliatus]|uniref:Uncharacterized protein n=1 Tax=Dimorphilus gyrociliatus TaxID=2664684 RepID=A0A7I8VJ90_9ANNE|nr:unnamed protein product [Dimorphilus gyrociliatus]
MTSASIQYYTGRPPDDCALDASSCLSHEARLKSGQRPSFTVKATPKIATVKPIRTVKPMRIEKEQSSQKTLCKHKCTDPILCKNCIQDLYTIKSPSQFNDHNKDDDFEEKTETEIEREKSANCWNKKYKTTLLPSIAEDSNCDSENDDTVFSSNSSSNGLHSASSEGSEYGGNSLLDSLHKRFYPTQYNNADYRSRLVDDNLSSTLSHSKSDGFVQVTSPKLIRRLPQSKCVSWTADDDRLASISYMISENMLAKAQCVSHVNKLNEKFVRFSSITVRKDSNKGFLFPIDGAITREI